jgi:hypothetical protein
VCRWVRAFLVYPGSACLPSWGLDVLRPSFSHACLYWVLAVFGLAGGWLLVQSFGFVRCACLCMAGPSGRVQLPVLRVQ